MMEEYVMETRKSILFVVILLVLTQISFAQLPAPIDPNCKIKGFLVDSEEKIPVEFANVVLTAENKTSVVTWSISNEKGGFELSKIAIGEYNVAISFVGYEEKKLSKIVFDKPGITLDLGKISLNKVSATIGEVTVVGIQKTYQSKIDKTVINVSKDINSTGGTAIDLIKIVPGLSVDADGVVNMRGNSGVSILVDGRPTSIDATRLDQIPAGEIESLEIINNPSAKYNPEGKSGIINIRMKQSKISGFSGSAMLSAGTGDKYNESLNLNYNFGKINLFAAFSGMNRIAVSSRYLLREAFDSDSIHFLQQEAKTNYDIAKNSFSLGSKINFNSQNKLTLSYAFNPSSQTDADNTLSQYYDRSMKKTGSVFVINAENEKENSNDYLLSYQKLFDKKGEELTVDYSFANSSGEIDQPQTYQFATKTSIKKIASSSDTYNSNFQVNWVLPLPNGSRLESGVHSIVRGNQSDFFLFNSVGSVLTEDLSQRDLFQYNEQIHAAYSLWSGMIGGASIQSGLRLEQTYINGRQDVTNEKISQNYFNLYPSFSMIHPVDAKSNIQLSYSRTIKRPMARMINPFVDRSNLEVFRSGNPDLKPEFINTIDLGYNGNWEKTIIGLTAFYKHINNPINQVTQLDANGISRMAPQNMTYSQNYGFELTFEHSIFNWWKVNGNASFFRNKIRDDVKDNSASNYSYLGRVNSSWNPSKSLSFQLIANYAGPIIGVYTKLEPQYSMDLAVKKDLLNNKLSLTLRASDVFNSLKNNYTSWGSNFSADNWRKVETQVLYFSVSYSFGPNGSSKGSKTIINNESKPSSEI
ncbi:MAG: TonB-dependent receptor [Prolixibacteraceae bacterium]